MRDNKVMKDSALMIICFCEGQKSLFRAGLPDFSWNRKPKPEKITKWS
jgi:hypothetical protein